MVRKRSIFFLPCGAIRFIRILIAIGIGLFALLLILTRHSLSPRSQQVECVSTSYTVCIDAGHGGSDPGASGSDRTEKDDTLAAALALQQAMEARNITVVMTRSDDTALTLQERVACAEKNNANLFLSLHRNVAEAGNGIEIWIAQQCSATSHALADRVHTNLLAVGVQNDRGIRTGTQSGNGDYYVLSHTTMPAVLIELGFMQDEEDNNLFDRHLTDYTDAIANAVVEICNKSN